MTVAELELLNTNIDRLDEFVDTLPVMKEINRNLEDWMTGIEELASKIMKHIYSLIYTQTKSMYISVFAG